MSQESESAITTIEVGEDRLQALIHDAGEASRARKKEAMLQHLAKVQAAIEEGLARPSIASKH